MTGVARINPKDYFTTDAWRALSKHSSWRGLWLVAHAWSVIALAAAMAIVWPVTIPLAIMVIGARQLGLGILMHDAAHRALHPNPKINDVVGEWFCAPGLVKYRTYHLNHHRLAQQSDDPDLVLSKPFPISATSLRRKILRDLTGQTFFKARFGFLVFKLKTRKPGQSRWSIIAGEAARQRRFLLGNLAGIVLFSAFGLWWVWPVLWLAPQATWFQMITRLRNIAEHACIAENEPDPLRQARTTRAGWLERALLAPYYVNYHCEHHMFMHLPCYSLPKANRLLSKSGATQRMLTAPGYRTVLGMAAGA
jgi:fatty acid desaturase